MFQILIVPVVDNTASVADTRYASWYENRNTVMLTPERMLWFRRNYLACAEDATRWDSSPVFAPDESFKLVPDAWIAVADLDILRDEGIAYGELLRRAGHQVEVKVYERSPHAIMAMDSKQSVCSSAVHSRTSSSVASRVSRMNASRCGFHSA